MNSAPQYDTVPCKVKGKWLKYETRVTILSLNSGTEKQQCVACESKKTREQKKGSSEWVRWRQKREERLRQWKSAVEEERELDLDD